MVTGELATRPAPDADFDPRGIQRTTVALDNRLHVPARRRCLRVLHHPEARALTGQRVTVNAIRDVPPRLAIAAAPEPAYIVDRKLRQAERRVLGPKLPVSPRWPPLG